MIGIMPTTCREFVSGRRLFNPSGVEIYFHRIPRVARLRATLGFDVQPLRGCQYAVVAWQRSRHATTRDTECFTKRSGEVFQCYSKALYIMITKLLHNSTLAPQRGRSFQPRATPWVLGLNQKHALKGQVNFDGSILCVRSRFTCPVGGHGVFGHYHPGCCPGLK